MTTGAWLALAAVALLAGGLIAFERQAPDPRRLALVAALAALAAASRLLIPIPSAKPVTALAILAGISLGPRNGAAVGAFAALLSNTLLGQGPWTPWQMVAWGAVGAIGGAAGQLLRRSRLALAVAGAGLALAYGVALNVWFLATLGPGLSLPGFVAAELRAAPFDLLHAVATVGFLLLLAPTLLPMLDRGSRRLRVEFLPVDASEAP